MTATGGWYIDPKNPERDAYWTGHIWSGANRPTEPGTPEFPEDGDWKPAIRPSRPSDAWHTRAIAVYAICALTTIGALIGGIVLAVRTGQTCTSNPYDAALTDCSDTHPFLATGVVIIVAGAIQAYVIYVIGTLCSAKRDSLLIDQPTAPAQDS